uniref:Uncharacterized protein n=1 Tax=Utricularia reniformis TaxID=192314 RepID=A0A1Y0B3J9_9LAMI|nr:hypothetical protein AEK19_MT1790 [Utricularia reniformis]ART31963.1 hypothetical protein AEK19_MT1790 [Utricularia reniformis]
MIPLTVTLEFRSFFFSKESDSLKSYDTVTSESIWASITDGRGW